MPRVIRVVPMTVREVGQGAIAVDALVVLRPEHEAMA